MGTQAHTDGMCGKNMIMNTQKIREYLRARREYLELKKKYDVVLEPIPQMNDLVDLNWIRETPAFVVYFARVGGKHIVLRIRK